MLAKDLKEIRMYDSNSLKALSQVISKAGTYTVVLNKDDIRTVGGALSSRIPLKTANGKKAFLQQIKFLTMMKNGKKILKILRQDLNLGGKRASVKGERDTGVT